MPDPTPLTPAKALKSTRIIWAAMVASQVVLLIVVAVLLLKGVMKPSNDPRAIQTYNMLHYSSLGLLVLGTFAGLWLRNQRYKRNWRGNLVTPRGYFEGNVLFFTVCEGISLFGLVIVLISGILWPYLMPSAVVMSVMIMNFPHGKPMLPAEPELLNRGR